MIVKYNWGARAISEITKASFALLSDNREGNGEGNDCSIVGPTIYRLAIVLGKKAMKDFAEKLREFRVNSAQLSQRELAEKAGLHASDISRYESHERHPPRREIVVNLGMALELAFEDRNELLVLAGYAPITIEETERVHPTVHSLIDVLDSNQVPEVEKDLLTRQIHQIQARYMQRRGREDEG